MSLVSQISSLITAVGQDIKSLFTKVGTLSSLTTTAKGSLVEAVNEVNAKPTGSGVTVVVGTTAPTDTSAIWVDTN